MSWPAGPDELRTQAGSEAHARVPALFEVLTHSCRSDSQIRVEDAADSTRGRRPRRAWQRCVTALREIAGRLGSVRVEFRNIW